MSETIAARAPVLRNVVRGVLQLLVALFFGAIVAIGVWGLLTLPADDPDRWGGLFVIGMSLPLFLLSFPYAGRHLHRLMLNASVTADAEKVVLRIPKVPFALAPYLVLREEVVPWPEADLTFTAGKNARLLVSSARPTTSIESGYFDVSLYEIDGRLRAAVEELKLGRAVIAPEHVFAGSSPSVLLGVGAALIGLCVVPAFLVDEALVESVTLLVAVPVLLGLALVAMGAAPRKRAVLDPRGLFFERGAHLDFVPRPALADARAEFGDRWMGAFQSGHLDVRVEGKRLRVGFNRVLGFGFAMDDVRTYLTNG